MFRRGGLKIPRLKITKWKFKLLTLTIFGFFSIVATLVYVYDYRTVTYFLRPIWDTPPKSFQVLSFLAAILLRVLVFHHLCPSIDVEESFKLLIVKI